MLDAFENAFANAPIGMALIDMTGHFLQVNDALCRITGYKRGELIVLLARALSHPDDVESDASQLQALLDGHVTSYQCEKRYVHAWGHSFWVLVTVSLVRDNQGQPLHLIS
jgi:PAS domain S-box-containing protein